MIEKIQIVCGDFMDSLEQMPIESVGRCFLALFRYANDMDYSDVLNDDIVAKSMFPTLKAHLDRQENYRSSRAGNGKKGGAPVGNQNAKQTTKNNQKQAKTSKNNQKQTPNPNPYPNPNPINNKRHYGECANVLLSDEEYEKIKTGGMIGLIDELSLYIASTGKTYKSHYAVIRQWANRRKNETKVIKPTQFNTGLMQRPVEEYDLDKLIKN